MTLALTTTRTFADEPTERAAPTFLVGCVRSGTTLLRLMLDHHPEVAMHFEFEHAVDRIGPNGELPSIDEYHAYLRQDRVFSLSGMTIDESLDYVALVDSFLTQHRRRGGKQYVGATVHHGFEKLPHLWPDAKYIHLLRDGRDVARSCIAMGWAGNMHCAVDRWIDAEQAWRRLCDQVPERRRFELRYDDLIAEPETTLKKVCRFVGVEYDAAMFRYAETSSYGLPDAKLLGQWRTKLSERDLQLAEARIGKMLVERGYDLSGAPEIEVSAGEAYRLRWADWWARAQFRRRRYGSWLFATDFVARRLGVAPLARWCKQRIDVIDNQHLR